MTDTHDLNERDAAMDMLNDYISNQPKDDPRIKQQPKKASPDASKNLLEYHGNDEDEYYDEEEEYDDEV